MYIRDSQLGVNLSLGSTLRG